MPKFHKIVLEEWDTYDIKRICNDDESLNYIGGIAIQEFTNHGIKHERFPAPKNWFGAKCIDIYYIELNGIKIELRCQIYENESAYRVDTESWFMTHHYHEDEKFSNIKNL